MNGETPSIDGSRVDGVMPGLGRGRMMRQGKRLSEYWELTMVHHSRHQSQPAMVPLQAMILHLRRVERCPKRDEPKS